MDRSDDYYDELIIKYLTNQADEGEIEEFENWLKESALHREIYESIERVWADKEDDAINIEKQYLVEDESLVKSDIIWNLAIREVESGVVIWKNKFQILSAIAAMIAVGVLFWVQKEPLKSEGTLVQIQTSGIAIDTVKIETAFGERKEVHLPDSSLIWLNSGATLAYAADFGITHRKIDLKGEAFFDVQKNKELPFLLNVYNITLEVTGTSFNVEAHQKERSIKVALLEGKVALSTPKSATTHALRSGELMTIDKQKEQVGREKFAYDDTFGWKEGILSFDGTTFSEFTDKLQRWYNVSIQLKGKVPNNWMLRAKYRHESIENVLKDISFNKDFTYVIQGTHLLITF